MRVLIADDHALFRQGLALVLADLFPGVEVGQAKDIDQALAQLAEGPACSLVLLDLAMPGMSGEGGERLEGLRRIVEAAPGVPVVMLSASSESADITRAIELGSRGYIPKGANESVLHHAISLVLEGEIYLPSALLAGLRAPVCAPAPAPAAPRPTAELQQALAALTPRQRDTLALLTLGRSNREIAQALNLLESTVKAHVRAVLQKLHVNNRTQAARIGMQLGLAPPGQGEEG